MGRHALVIMLATILFVTSPCFALSFQSRALNLFLKTLNSQLNGSLDAESIEFRPPSTLVLTNASLKSKDGKKLLSVKKVVGSFSLAALALAQIRFNVVEATEPSGDLQVNKGDLDLLAIFESKNPSTKKKAKPVFFKSLVVHEGRVSLRFDNDFSCQMNNLSFVSGPFDTDFDKVSLSQLKMAFQADTLPLSLLIDGKLDAQLKKDQDAILKYHGALSELSLYDMRIKDRSIFDTSVRLGHTLLEVQSAHIENDKMNFRLHGEYHIQNESVHMILSSFVKDAADLFVKVEPEAHLYDTKLETTFIGPFKNPLITSAGEGRMSGALFVGKGVVDTKTQKIEGEVKVDSKADVSMRPWLKEDYFLSAPKGSAKVSGTLNNLKVEGVLGFSRLYSSTMMLAGGTLPISFTNQQLVIEKGLIVGNQGALSVDTFVIDFKSKGLSGQGRLEGLDLLPALRINVVNSKTLTDATIAVKGTIQNPHVKVEGRTHDVAFRNRLLGDADFIAFFGDEGPRILSVSGILEGATGHFDFRSAIDTERKQTHSRIEIKDYRADDIVNAFAPWIKFGPSTFNGDLEISGPLAAPEAELQLWVDADYADPEMAPLFAHAKAVLQNRRINATLCASIDHGYSDTEVCSKEDTLSFEATGSFNDLDNYALNYTGQINAENAERMSDFLHNELILLALQTKLSGTLEKRANQPLVTTLDAEVGKLVADFPELPIIRLENPFHFKATQNGFSLQPKALFSLSGGELSLEGSLEKDRIKGELTGRIPLLFSRLLSKNIVEASGLAFGQLALSGLAKRPNIDGILVPDQGSSIRFRALPDTLTFLSGAISSTLDPSSSDRLNANVDHLLFHMGNSNVELNGTLRLDFLAEDEADILENADMTLKANDLSLPFSNFQFEGDLDLKLQTIQNTHWLFGRAMMEAGRYQQDFSLNNFQFEALAKPGDRLTLPAFFSHFQSNLSVDIASIDLDSNLAVFDFSGSASGSLNVVGELSAPRVTGIMELSDSELKFPSATFEIPSSIIKFRNTPDKSVDPEIHLKATAELPRQDFGLSDDTSVELSLDGNLDRLNLDLRSIAGDRTLDRLKILLLLLNAGGGSGNASAFLLKPLTSELEGFLSEVTKTRFRIASQLSTSGFTTSIQWRLNPRLDLEGSASFGSTNLGLQDAKFKLLLFDHLPFGRELFLEGIFFSPATILDRIDNSQTLRLTYRLLEQ